MEKQQWGTRSGFILAAVGSAVGLGNIWRFPYTAYDNGGGTFLIPYLFALLTTGLSILILEFALGHRHRRSAPMTFHLIHKNIEFIGWWQVVIAFIVSTYYSVILAWSLSYTFFSLHQLWGNDTESFLFNQYLQVGTEPGTLGGLVPGVAYPLIIIWIIVLAISIKGIKKGIEKINRIFIPALVIMFSIIVLRAITLEGAILGLESFFTPDWRSILHTKVWMAAYGQVFFSLSICMGVMITYSSYLPKKSDTTNNAFITAFSNSSFEMLAGIGVFSALGFMSSKMEVSLDEVVTGGVGLAFVIFPKIINELPFPSLFGVLFFLSLVVAGITSLISLLEVSVSAICDKFQFNRKKIVLCIGGSAGAISLIFATRGGLMLLDVVDYFTNNIVLLIVGLLEIGVLSIVIRRLDVYKKHANLSSDMKIGYVWKYSLLLITPFVLAYMLFQGLLENLTNNYEGYPTQFLLLFGWNIILITIVLAFILMWSKKKITKS